MTSLSPEDGASYTSPSSSPRHSVLTIPHPFLPPSLSSHRHSPSSCNGWLTSSYNTSHLLCSSSLQHCPRTCYHRRHSHHHTASLSFYSLPFLLSLPYRLHRAHSSPPVVHHPRSHTHPPPVPRPSFDLDFVALRRCDEDSCLAAKPRCLCRVVFSHHWPADCAGAKKRSWASLCAAPTSHSPPPTVLSVPSSALLSPLCSDTVMTEAPARQQNVVSSAAVPSSSSVEYTREEKVSQDVTQAPIQFLTQEAGPPTSSSSPSSTSSPVTTSSPFSGTSDVSNLQVTSPPSFMPR